MSIWLREDDWDASQLRGADAFTRRQLIEARQAAIAPSQDEVAGLVHELGGQVVARQWLTNTLSIAVPASSVDSLLSDDLVGAAYLPATATPTAAGDGLDRMMAFSSNLGVFYNGYSGGRATDGTGPMMICILEAGGWYYDYSQGVTKYLGFNDSHVGWLNSAGGASRVVSNKKCTASSCPDSNVNPTSPHGTVVASVAAGSILEHQDINFPGFYTTEEYRRSGLMTEASVGLYASSSSITIGNSDQMAKAIEQAVADGCDILNNSWQMHNTAENVCDYNCSNYYNPSGIRQKIDNAVDAGMVFIAAAGNSHDPDADCNQACDVVFPADVPDALSVGALGDTLNYASYRGASLADYSSRGGIGVTLQGGLAASMPGVGLVGFGTTELSFSLGASSYAAHGLVEGTSFAAPQIASLAGAFRQWMASASISFFDKAWPVMINTYLMGDGWCGPSCTEREKVSLDSGFGFPKFFVPVAYYIGSGAAWGTRSFSIIQGQTVAWTVGDSGPEGNDVNGWKFALAVDTTTFAFLPELNVRVVDTCHGDVVIATAAKQANLYRMMISDTTKIRGRCLEMRVTGIHVKYGGETLWSADYYFTNSVGNHIWVP